MGAQCAGPLAAPPSRGTSHRHRHSQLRLSPIPQHSRSPQHMPLISSAKVHLHCPQTKGQVAGEQGSHLALLHDVKLEPQVAPALRLRRLRHLSNAAGGHCGQNIRGASSGRRPRHLWRPGRAGQAAARRTPLAASAGRALQETRCETAAGSMPSRRAAKPAVRFISLRLGAEGRAGRGAGARRAHRQFAIRVCQALHRHGRHKHGRGEPAACACRGQDALPDSEACTQLPNYNEAKGEQEQEQGAKAQQPAGIPSSVMLVSTSCTSTSTRGSRRQRASAASLSRSVYSPSAPLT